ncbi:NCS2 family permease [Zooshikella sp. RANM57]|uniref:NCS2 family permease n=1 Tax=Zooshikella sp. RANM57 TaxID=3425863 RepID=UPI003D6F1FC0
MLEALFRLKEHHTTVRREFVAGCTTFLTMAYIIFVNPNMLASAGMDQGAVFVATCIAAALGCFIMGFFANYPIALAPGMGLNAFFTYTVVGQLGYSWQVALGAVFLSGCFFFILSAFKIREWIIHSIPHSLRVGIAAGIGLFLGFIALKNAGFIADNPATLVTLGNVHAPSVLLAAMGFIMIIALSHRQVPGAVMLSILTITLLSIVIGETEYQGLVALPPSIMPTLLALNIREALDVGLLSIIFAFVFVDLFDTSGTLIAVAQKGELLDEKGRLPRLGNALMADSTATMAGAMLGTSTTTSYIESIAGISAGGRTGLTAVVVGVLFLASLFLSPLVNTVPAYATAPALFFVAVLMTGGLANIDWQDITEAAPVTIAALTMPLTFSISNGIALGFIAYAVVKLCSGHWRSMNPAMLVLSGLFVVKLVLFN